MNLLDNEKVIKKWDYGSIQLGKESRDCSLTVTNKRIVEETTSALGMKRTEMPINAVQGVSTMHQTASKVAAIILMVCGALLALIGIIIAVASDSTSLLAPFLVTGLALLIFGVIMFIKKPIKFNVIIYTPATSCGILAGMTMGALKIKPNTIKIKANVDVAVDMAETISNVILMAQDTNNAAPQVEVE